MRIVLSPMGTAGDIRPFIALHTSLKKLGNEVIMVIPKNGEELCKKFDVSYHLIQLDYRDYVRAVGKKPSIKEITGLLNMEISTQFEGLQDVAASADLLIGGARNYALQPMAELYGIQYYQVWHTPQVYQSSQHASWRFSSQNNPPWLNHILWKINNIKENAVGKEFINKHRVRLGLQPVNDFVTLSRTNTILSVDQALAPIPSDVTAEYIQSGYWYLFEDEELDSDLVSFINRGSPPLFFGLGSMPDMSGRQTVELLEDVVKSLDMRAIVQKGWAGLGTNNGSERIMVVDNVPHYKLFPYMSAVIHHGGAGTMHTAAIAGVPQIVVPQMADQFFWGERVRSLLIGPHPIRKSKLTKKNLKETIYKAVHHQEYRENAKRLAELLRLRDNMDEITKRLMAQMTSKIEITFEG